MQTSDFHQTATHVDAYGMPVAFYDDEFIGKRVAYYPTPCCGASAKGLEHYVGCRACHKPIDPSFGGVPVEPITPIHGDAA